MRLLELWGDLEHIRGDGTRGYYYRVATITWSRPRIWSPEEDQFEVPQGWSGLGGVYAFLRQHWRQEGGKRIAYIGKAINFNTRLTSRHNHFDIIQRRGNTYVSCGRIAFERIRSRPAFYLEIEDVIKFAVWHHLENDQGFHSLPGFRTTQPKVMVPWYVKNEGYRFNNTMPKRIAYPSIGVSY